MNKNIKLLNELLSEMDWDYRYLEGKDFKYYKSLENSIRELSAQLPPDIVSKIWKQYDKTYNVNIGIDDYVMTKDNKIGLIDSVNSYYNGKLTFVVKIYTVGNDDYDLKKYPIESIYDIQDLTKIKFTSKLKSEIQGEWIKYKLGAYLNSLRVKFKKINSYTKGDIYSYTEISPKDINIFNQEVLNRLNSSLKNIEVIISRKRNMIVFKLLK